MNECLICLDKLNPEDFENTTLCTHIFCKKCNYNNIKVKIDNFELDNIKCMAEKCDQKLSKKNILMILTIFDDEISINKYNKFLDKHFVYKNPNYRICINNECEKLIKINLNNPKLECNYCKVAQCIYCGDNYHEGKCKDNDIKDNLKLPENNEIKKCPNCKIKIFKDSGCNHITCKICNYEFCWWCKKHYTVNHFSKFNPNGCPGALYAKNKKEANKIKIKIILVNILLILLSPLIFVVLILLTPNILFKMYEMKKIKKDKTYTPIKGNKLYIINSLLFLLGILLSPIFVSIFIILLVLSILGGIILLISKIIDKIRGKKK